MRGRLRVFVGVVVLGVAVAGCVVPAGTSAVLRTDPSAVRRTIERRVAVRAAIAPRAAVVADRPSDAAARRGAMPAASSPWSQFSGELPGPSYAVAHARGPSLPVAAEIGGPAIAALSNPTRVGAPRVALVVADAGEWLQVLLPLRPNNSVGWVRRDDVDVTHTTLRVEIDRAARRLRVTDNGAVVMDEIVAVGRSRTPTPTGVFFTTELLQPPNPAGAYGPFAFTLSGYSTVYQRFGSGDGAVGIHGTNEPALLGGEVSHGCVRLSNDAVTQLATMLPLGTPVIIR